MKSLRFIEDGILYVAIITWTTNDYTRSSDWEVHSCWRFYPGRTSGESISYSRLPWRARQEIAELLNNSMP